MRHTGKSKVALESMDTRHALGSELLNVRELAEFLHIRPSTVRAWRQQRKLAFVKLGGRVFARKSDAEAFIAASVVPAKEKA